MTVRTPVGLHPRWDAVIVGSGFGGAMCALVLARAGLRVLVLERGRWVDRDDSCWDAEPILIRRKYRSATPVEVDQRGRLEDHYPDDTVGGKSVFYGAASMRLREADFRMRSLHAGTPLAGLPYADWPSSYAELEPYYAEAESLLGVVGVAGADPTDPWRSGPYAGAPPPFSSPSRRLEAAGRSLGLAPFPLPLAINYDGRDGRTACVRCTTCDLFPCKIGAKNDLAVTVLPEAMRHGATVRANALATRLVMEGNAVRGVEFLDLATRRSEEARCGVCIVSGGAVGSAHLLLVSGLGRREPNGALVGRYLMRHSAGVVIGVCPFPTNPEQRFHKQVAFSDVYLGGPPGTEPPGHLGVIQGHHVPPQAYIRSEAPLGVKTIAAATQPFHLNLLLIAEDLPQAENRVTASATRRDAFGMPLARIRHRYASRDLAARRALERLATRIVRRAGAVLVHRHRIRTFSHALGTCRFGTDPAGSVLDPHCRFHGVRNLLVVDGSCFPTSGGVNPSLTIAANALRVARHLADHPSDYLSA